MKEIENRWGEVTVKKQGSEGKNDFDKTKSFSVQQTSTNYTIVEYKEILRMTTHLTETIPFIKLKSMLNKLNNKKEDKI